MKDNINYLTNIEGLNKKAYSYPMRGTHLAKVRPSKEDRLKALGVEALEGDEVSPQVRLRLTPEVWKIFRDMSSKERGQVVEAGLTALGVDYAKEES